MSIAEEHLATPARHSKDQKSWTGVYQEKATASGQGPVVRRPISANLRLNFKIF